MWRMLSLEQPSLDENANPRNDSNRALAVPNARAGDIR